MLILLLFGGLVSVRAEEVPDSLAVQKKVALGEVVVTGTRSETDVRHLPMTVSVVNREQIEQRNESSLLPLLTENIPGLFTTSRGILGYGVSGGAAGGMSLRGTSYLRCLPVDAGRAGGSASRTGFRVVWFQCHGRCD